MCANEEHSKFFRAYYLKHKFCDYLRWFHVQKGQNVSSFQENTGHAK